MNPGVKDRPQSNPPVAGTKPGGRRRARRVFLAGLGILVLVQSITFTFPIRARLVNEQTGEPLPHTDVVAVWELIRATPAGAIPGPVLRVECVRTNEQGELRIGPALMMHAPLLPLSWFMRSHLGTPVLYIAKDGFYARGVVEDSPSEQRKPARAYLFVRRSSIDGASISVKPSDVDARDAEQQPDYRWSWSLITTEIEEALGMCSASWFCQLAG